MPIATDAMVEVRGDRVILASTRGLHIETHPFGMMARAATDDLYQTYVNPKLGARLITAYARNNGVMALRVGLGADEEATDLPACHDLAVPAGEQMVDAMATDGDAVVLEIDPEVLRGKLARVKYLDALHIEATSFAEMVGNARSRALREVGDTVRKGIENGDAKMTSRLRAKLALAFKMVKEPAQRAVETRRNNQQVAHKAAAAERAKNTPTATTSNGAAAGTSGGATGETTKKP